jgi:Ca2+ transporting ATPase
MLKHVIGQGVFQVLILVILVFWGERFIPEFVDSYDTSVFAGHPEWKWHNGIVGGTVRSGRMTTIGGSYDYRTIFDDTGIYSRHFTFVFNTFVMMTLFNFINSRKLHDEVIISIFS